MLERIFCGMWLHELGHAATAWLLGYAAFPGPWLTPMASERSLLFSLLVPAILLALAARAWRAEKIAAAALLAASAPLLYFLASRVSPARARELIVFFGDGGALIFGTLCMLTLYAPAGSNLKRGWLRWGFLAIGAAAYADVATVWWGARSDVDLIPYGLIEGVGLSDPSVLSERFGWSASMLVARYCLLAGACFVVLAAAWLRGILIEPELSELED